jgi:DNA-binding response OmpR family regulator
MAFKILLVEDSKESGDLVFRALGPAFDVKWSLSLNEANQLVKKDPFDLILLDVGLPDGDGFHFYSMLKNEDRHRDTPVIFLTAHDSVSDKIMGITMGAEDYIVKPFMPGELKARVEMRIKKRAESNTSAKTIKKGTLEVNLAEQRAFIREGQTKTDLSLTGLEFRVLSLLAAHDEQVFSRDDILNKIWGDETYLTDRCIDTHIYSLRKKLGGSAGMIQSVYGQGYRFSILKRSS